MGVGKGVDAGRKANEWMRAGRQGSGCEEEGKGVDAERKARE